MSRAASGPAEGDCGSDVQVLILEDHQLLSASLAAALTTDGYRVATPDLADRDGLLAYIAEMAPGVALVDLDLGSFGSGEELLPHLVEAGTRVLETYAERSSRPRDAAGGQVGGSHRLGIIRIRGNCSDSGASDPEQARSQQPARSGGLGLPCRLEPQDPSTAVRAFGINGRTGNIEEIWEGVVNLAIPRRPECSLCSVACGWVAG